MCQTKQNVMVTFDNPQTSIVLGWRQISLKHILKPAQIKPSCLNDYVLSEVGEEIHFFVTWFNPFRVQMFKLVSRHFSLLETCLLNFSTCMHKRQFLFVVHFITSKPTLNCIK